MEDLGWEDPLEKGMATHSLQYSCLENAVDRGAWQATVHGFSESDMTKRLKYIPCAVCIHGSLRGTSLNIQENLIHTH